ncbi:MAG: serine/threonine-protein kinase [Planctomycetia bacterium]|nr:serine/threonine-protein kinase [Planctomycetia bacterium]
MLHPKQLGPFRIIRVIGRGGMGAVYEAVHEETNETVAVKMLLNPPDDENNDQKNRFEAEIETLKRLRHPNIVRLHGFGQEEGLLYYAMEYVNGPSLQTFLKKKRLFTWEEVVFIGIEICKALKHAHDRGIIHRDIKPANILLVDNGQIKVSDYGIAHFFGNSRMTDCNMVIGTIEYMSPEQAQAGPLTPRSDIYSLGALLYTLITNNPPYCAKNLPEILKKYKEGPPESVRFTRPEVPPLLDQLILELLKTRPDKRPLDARLIGRRLEAIRLAYSKNPDQNPFLLKSFALQEQYYQDKNEDSEELLSNPPESEYHSCDSSFFSINDEKSEENLILSQNDSDLSSSKENINKAVKSKTGHYQPIYSDNEDATDSRIHLENTSTHSHLNEETCFIGSLHATFSKNNGPSMEFPLSSSGEATASHFISVLQKENSAYSKSENTDFVLYDHNPSQDTISGLENDSVDVKLTVDSQTILPVVTKEFSTQEALESCSSDFEEQQNLPLSTKANKILSFYENQFRNQQNLHSQVSSAPPVLSLFSNQSKFDLINSNDFADLNDLTFLSKTPVLFDLSKQPETDDCLERSHLSCLSELSSSSALSADISTTETNDILTPKTKPILDESEDVLSSNEGASMSSFSGNHQSLSALQNKETGSTTGLDLENFRREESTQVQSQNEEARLAKETVSMTQDHSSSHFDSFLEHPNETTVFIQNRSNPLNYMNSVAGYSKKEQESTSVVATQKRQDQSHQISESNSFHFQKEHSVSISSVHSSKEGVNLEPQSDHSDAYSSVIPIIDDSESSEITLKASKSGSFSLNSSQILFADQNKPSNDQITLFSTNAFVFDPSTAQPLPPHVFDKKTHFTAVDESELDKLEVENPPLISLKTWVFSFILIIVGLIVWFMLQPPTADTLYQQIVGKIQKGEDVNWINSLRAVERDLIRFSEYYPNDFRMNEIQYYKDELAIEELDRKLDRFIERRYLDQKSIGHLSSVETSYIIMMRQVKDNPESAIKRLQDFIHFFSTNIISSSKGDNVFEELLNNKEKLDEPVADSKESSISNQFSWFSNDEERLRRRTLIQSKPGQCVLLAERKLIHFEEEQHLIQKQLEVLLDEQIQLANELMNNDPEDAFRLKKNIILFFSDYNWAKPKLQLLNDSLKTNPSGELTSEH